MRRKENRALTILRYFWVAMRAFYATKETIIITVISLVLMAFGANQLFAGKTMLVLGHPISGAMLLLVGVIMLLIAFAWHTLVTILSAVLAVVSEWFVSTFCRNSYF